MSSPSTWLPQSELVPSLAISGLCMLMIRLAPLITKALPSSLIALFVSSICAMTMKLNVKTLADVTDASVFLGGWKSFPAFVGFPQLPLTWQTLAIVLPTSMTIMTISMIETVLAEKIKCQGIKDLNDQEITRSISTRTSSSSSSSSRGSTSGSSTISSSSSKTDESVYDENMMFECPVDAMEVNRMVDRSAMALGVGNAVSALFGGK